MTLHSEMPLQASPLWRLKHRNSPKLLCNELSCEKFMHLSIFHHVFIYLLVRYLTLVSLPVCHAMFTLGLSVFSYYQHITGVVKEAKSKAEMLTDIWLSVRHCTIWQNITNTREVTYYMQRSLQNIISMVLWFHSTTHSEVLDAEESKYVLYICGLAACVNRSEMKEASSCWAHCSQLFLACVIPQRRTTVLKEHISCHQEPV